MNIENTQNSGGRRRFLLPVSSLCLGLVVFAGTATMADKEEFVVPVVSATSVASDSAPAASQLQRTNQEKSDRQRKAAPTGAPQLQDSTDPAAVEFADQESVRHIGRVVSGTPVPSNGAAASRAAGPLALGDTCDCDQDCDTADNDACNVVQCIVRSFCSDDTSVPCESTAECFAAGAGTCTPDPSGCISANPPNCNFVQRCALVQLIDWPCDADADFCTSDLCEDDGTDSFNSVCVAQDDGSGSPLSVCGKHCVGGPANGLRCTQSSDCSQGACKIIAGGGCNSGAEACFVGATLGTAIGRCCSDALEPACTETDEATCTGGGGNWYRYRNPEEQDGDGFCLCPKYGSGVAPEGPDSGSSSAFGLVRPSGLMCDRGSRRPGSGIIYCEDFDGDGESPNFCQNRCVGGDNVGGTCLNDSPDCALLGFCSVGGSLCAVANNGADCGLCSISGGGCDGTVIQSCPPGEFCDFSVEQTCPASNPGTCVIDNCVLNDIEGGCVDGFLNIGDDYAFDNDSHLRLSQFRFRGGVSVLGEDIVIEFWDSTGTQLIDAFAIFNLGRTGTHDWTIEVDCWPNCDTTQLEVPTQNPIIIPPTGYVVMRSLRTVGTINGAAAFWEQTDNADTFGSNDDTKAWVNGSPGSLGTNVFIFELVGTKIDDPLGACCTDAVSCLDKHRWECGICSRDGECAGGANDGDPCRLADDPSVCADPGVCAPIVCASSLNDCPNGFLSGNICEFNNWFGPISHDEIEFGGLELTLCDGISPCDKGACCVGEACTLLVEGDCDTAGGDFQGIATDCTPNCCPVDVPTGSDCACETKICEQTDGTLTDRFCSTTLDCDGTDTCEIQCTPAGVTQLRHPYECHDDFGSPLEPLVDCDPANGDPDGLNNTDCNIGLDEVCLQSFTGAVVVARNDTIPPVADLFIASEGELCSLNTAADRVGWFELINLADPTPGDGTDDCFKLTVGLCCTFPVLSPIWPFLSSFRTCPCIETADVNGQAPDIDFAGNQLDGFGANSLANQAGRCEDTNYSATFTVGPGDYAYQINSDTSCAASIIGCDNDDDCPGSTCIVPNPDYSVVFAVESCQIAACCVGATCILTNELDCATQQGVFLGDGDQPIVTCQAGACSLGSCCVSGECNDDQFHDEEAECLAQDGTYIGGLTCDDGPCSACPFDSPQNCQQVQTIFGRVPMMDRNPDNYGANSDPFKAGASMHADDVKFSAFTVDQICWNSGFFSTPCCGGACTANVDDTWEIRVYAPDPDCDAYPGVQVGMSTITVLNKVAGTGQGANNWHYSGKLNTPIGLPNGGLAGDTYWFEVTAFGETGCEIRATWSRDHGNEHMANTVIQSENDSRVYKLKNVETLVDLGFCENSGIATPDTVLGSCCTCPGTCQNDFSFRDCDQIRGHWVACETCATRTAVCGAAPTNDDCSTPDVVTDVPATLDGSAFLTVAGQNICATDDGPALDDDDSDPEAENCETSLGAPFFGELHDDIWLEYTATDCGDLRIHSCDTTDQDMMIAIYDGAVGCPMTTANELACDHNNCDDFFDSDVTLRVFAGQRVLVRIGGFNNEVPGGFDNNPRGSWTTQWSLETNCPAVLPPVRAAAPHAIRKNRYISVNPRGALGNNPDTHHIKVEVESTLVADLIGSGPWWANPPVNGLPPSPATCISIVTTTKPASEPDWSGCPTLHLTGCPIIPTTTYAVFAESGGLLSVPESLDTMALATGKWLGDVVGQFSGPPDNVWTDPNFVVNIDDAVAGIKTFIDPNGVNATHLSVTDIHPVLNGIQMTLLVNINDVLLIIAGFQGKTWGQVADPNGGNPPNIPDITLCP